MCFRSTFQGREYSIWATNRWKLFRTHIRKGWFGLPKSSFGEHKVVKKDSTIQKNQHITDVATIFCNHLQWRFYIPKIHYPTHKMMIAWRCVLSNSHNSESRNDDSITMRLSESQDDDSMTMCMSNSTPSHKAWRCVCRNHKMIRAWRCASYSACPNHYFESQDDDSMTMLMSKSQDDDSTTTLLSKSQDYDSMIALSTTTKILEGRTNVSECFFESTFQRFVAQIEYSRPWKVLSKKHSETFVRPSKIFGRGA